MSRYILAMKIVDWSLRRVQYCTVYNTVHARSSLKGCIIFNMHHYLMKFCDFEAMILQFKMICTKVRYKEFFFTPFVSPKLHPDCEVYDDTFTGGGCLDPALQRLAGICHCHCHINSVICQRALRAQDYCWQQLAEKPNTPLNRISSMVPLGFGLWRFHCTFIQAQESLLFSGFTLFSRSEVRLPLINFFLFNLYFLVSRLNLRIFL